MSAPDIHDDIVNILVTGNEIRNQIADGDLPPSHWLRVYHRLQIIRETCELCQTRLADAGLIPADYSPEVPLVSLGQGEYRQEFFGNPVRSQGVFLG